LVFVSLLLIRSPSCSCLY